MSWLDRFFHRKPNIGRVIHQRRVLLSLEQLEDRLAPVVGAFSTLTPIAPLTPLQPASDYDGVANINRGPEGISGSLIATGEGWSRGHHILTVAHSIGTSGPGQLPVRFHLQRGGVPVSIDITIFTNVPGGAQYQIPHSGYQLLQGATAHNDIALLLLVDQENPAPDRLLVAPFTAQQYGLYGGTPSAVGQQFVMAGYGYTGRGRNGYFGPLGAKRAGSNRFDSTAARDTPGWTNYLMYDFDRLNDPNGRPDLDPLNVLYGITDAGLGVNEAMHAGGDSGGPAFIGGQIAGVLSQIGRRGSPPDIDNDPKPNATFGEIGLVTNVTSTIGDAALQGVLNPGGGKKYHLVLDMEQQVLGRDGVLENIAITAQRSANGANLELVVGGSGAGTLNNIYYSAPAANIQSLTIRGGPDNETIRLVGNLGVGPITINGRSGNNTIVVGDPATGNLNDVLDNIVIDGGLGGTNHLEVNDFAAPAGRNNFILTRDTLSWGAAANIKFSNINSLTLQAGGFDDTINVQATKANTTTTIHPGAGTNTVNVGSTNNAASTVNDIRGELFVIGDGGADTLNVNDQGAFMLPGVYTITDDTVETPVATIHYDGLTNLVVNCGGHNDTIQVSSTASVTTTTINAGGGDDTFLVSNGNHRLDDLQGALTVDGQTGLNNIIIDDSGSPAGHEYQHRKVGSVTRVGGPIIETLNWNTREIRYGRAPQPIAIPGNRGRVLSAHAGTRNSLRLETPMTSSPSTSPIPCSTPWSRSRVALAAIRSSWPRVSSRPIGSSCSTLKTS